VTSQIAWSGLCLKPITYNADSLGMEIEMTPMALCYKCERPSIALGDSDRPLCSRHAMLFATAPRLLAHTAAADLDAVQESDTQDFEGADGGLSNGSEAVFQSIDRITERLEKFDGTIDSILSPTASSNRHEATEIAPIPNGVPNANSGLRLVGSPRSTSERLDIRTIPRILPSDEGARSQAH
jgi:hypothetical protein